MWNNKKLVYVIYEPNYSHYIDGELIERFNTVEDAEKWINEQENKIRVFDVAQSVR